jgi:C4-dicarboxylate transporter DctQ subunit
MPPPFFPTLRRRIHAACVWYCLGAFVLMLGVVLLQVLMRNVLGLPLPWAEEASIYLMISLGLFGSAFVMMEKGHLCVDMVVGKFPEGLRLAVSIATLLVEMVFVCLILFFSLGSLEYADKVAAISLGISMWLPYLSIPGAFAVILLEILLQLADAVYELVASCRGRT